MTLRFAWRRLAVQVAGVAVVAGVFSACSASSNQGTPECPTVAATCPSPPPSYKTDVQPIIQSHCYACHGPGGIEVSKFDLTTYQGVAENDVSGEIGGCFMPPPGNEQPTADERQTLLDWVACGQPNN
jgi:hypothetical protein